MEAELAWVSYPTDRGSGWIGWRGDGMIERMLLPGQPQPLAEAKVVPTQVAALADALTKYFFGEADLPLMDRFVDVVPATDFEAAVYQTVTAIPAGTTMTYGEVAADVGHPGAARAVGAAMAKNRFAPMIPCHRVVGSDGSLRGYGGGLDMKKRLLAIEASRA